MANAVCDAIIPELESNLDPQDEDTGHSVDSPSDLHFSYDLPEVLKKDYFSIYEEEKEISWPEIGSYFQTAQHLKNIPAAIPLQIKSKWEDFNLKSNLQKLFETSKVFSAENLTALQAEYFSIINSYYDILFSNRTDNNAEPLRQMYCLHIMNHVLHNRAKIIHHNSKLSKNPDEEHRDQGFTRTTCLILVPFRQDCYKIVMTLISLLDKVDVMNKKRFERDFGSDEKPRVRKRPRPDDYEATFSGNTNEDFKLGVKIKNRSICLYADFYSADLIIASPVGLRQVVGAEGDRTRDYDFLSSVQIVVIDQTEVLMMQNWYHLVHILKHLNLLPKESHGCNFFRVYSYALDGLAKFYRQTIVHSSIEHAWFKALFSHGHCFNHAGYLRTWADVKTPSICQVVIPLPQVFRRFETSLPKDELDDRFNFFTSEVLPHFKDEAMAQTLIYIQSYVDFVRLRNFFRSEEISAVMLCEYSDRGKVAQARDVFYKGYRHFMLYTERAHFYNRYSIKGIRHVVFYQLPAFPHFYQEICNLMLHENPKKSQGLVGENSCTILVSKFDCIQLKHVVGISKTKHILSSEKKVFMIKTNNE